MSGSDFQIWYPLNFAIPGFGVLGGMFIIGLVDTGTWKQGGEVVILLITGLFILKALWKTKWQSVFFWLLILAAEIALLAILN